MRRNGGGAQMRIIEAAPSEQPELPTFDVSVEIDGNVVMQQFVWPERTRQWWDMWASSPLSDEFTETDWSELMDTALIHAKFWTGNTSVANELRLRVAKFGATPEDRARLKIQFAAADEAEERTEKRRAAKKPKGDDPRLRLAQ
ncbi:hypothetical protein P5G50_18390 [Leifsonia sp. F6_8S_P_1B]|uniref:Bacteriophage Gp15 protein n=1 Tax=Leifsonia williamsii TaxID=3035919 RepID=A0ABT8KG40_9MICO|nr:hypothetical protein [Leifsonia williamsii]MDN4616421.1 hypothetical protein [Leifsonia williamsii]